MDPLRNQTVMIAGGGAVGRACAWRLRQAGANVVVIDPGRDPLPAWYGNAGHICIEQPEPWANWSNIARAPKKLFAVGGPLDFIPKDIGRWLPWSLKFIAAANRFEEGTAALVPPLARAKPAWLELLEEIGRSDLIHEGGHYVVWDTEETAEAGLRRYAAAETGAGDPVPSGPEYVEKIETMLGRRIGGALCFRNTAHVMGPGLIAEALDEALEGAGVERRRDCVDRIEIENGRVALHLRSGAVERPDIALVTAGVWSRELMQSAGHAAPLIAERGYHVQTQDHDWDMEFPPILFEDRHVICTPFQTGLRATSYSEFGHPESPADPRKWDRLEKWLAALGVPARGPFERWMGSRPTLPDYLPAIGRSGRAGNLLYAFGHQHLGLTLSAVTGEYVAALAAGDPPPEIAPFDLGRFG